jgi:phosphohistidine phosphatase
MRPLTLKGRKKMQKVCLRLRDFVSDIDLIVASPFERSRQSAQIVASVYGGKRIFEAPELVPHSPPQAFLKWLRIQGRSHRRILAVGHEPHLGSFLGLMLTGRPQSFIDLKKSGIVSIRLESFANADPGGAQLLYSIPPRFLIE